MDMEIMKKVKEFVDRQVSDSTKKTYGNVLGRAIKFYGEKWPEESSGKWTGEYAAELSRQGCGNNTINLHLTVLGKFYKYATGEKLYYDRLKQSKREIEFLSDSETEKLIGGAGVALRPVIKFLLDTGARVGEVEKISKQTFESVPTEFCVMGKGRKQRILVISEQTSEVLRGVISNGKIFGKEWNTREIQRAVKKAGVRGKIGKNVHPHMLRHTFATKMLNDGADIEALRKMLGHSFLATTQIYTHVTDERLREVWQKFHHKQ